MTYKKLIVKVAKTMELIYCETCGAIIFDNVAHDAWHKTIANIGDMASSADIMTRPIGPKQGSSYF